MTGASHLRPATPADIESLMALAAASSSAAHWTRQQYEEVFSRGRSRYAVIVIEENSALCSFIVARSVAPEWEIENLAVASSHLRRGLATQLVAAVVDLARAGGVLAIFLEVRESNHAARAFYEKLAFAPCGRRKDYYRDPLEDAVLYRLQLA